MRWEYDLLAMSLQDHEGARNDLNDFGRDGWELVAILPQSSEALIGWVLAVFKRPVRTSN